jgi:dihydrofolate reductase
MEGLQYPDFIRTVDSLVMGHNTFEKVLTFEPWPYAGTPVVVLSDSAVSVPRHLTDHVRIMSGEPATVVNALAAEGKQHLYIDGGVTIQRFFSAGLISDVTITIIPVILGDGIPLFASGIPEAQLTLVDCQSSENGFVQVRYTL